MGTVGFALQCGRPPMTACYPPQTAQGFVGRRVEGDEGTVDDGENSQNNRRHTGPAATMIKAAKSSALSSWRKEVNRILIRFCLVPLHYASPPPVLLCREKNSATNSSIRRPYPACPLVVRTSGAATDQSGRHSLDGNCVWGEGKQPFPFGAAAARRCRAGRRREGARTAPTRRRLIRGCSGSR